MAEGVYRLYSNNSYSSVLHGLTISFIEADTDQPLLLVAEIRYADKSSDIKTVCREWDLWGIYFDWGVQRNYDEVLSFTSIDRAGSPPPPAARRASSRACQSPTFCSRIG